MKTFGTDSYIYMPQLYNIFMSCKVEFRTTIYLDAEAKDVLDRKPRSFNLSAFVREKLKESEE